MFPKVKRKVASFLVGEEGRVSRQSLLSLGAFLSVAVIGGVLATRDVAAQHTNTFGVSFSPDTAVGTHAHHSVHSSATTVSTTDTTGGSCSGTGPSTTSTTGGETAEGVCGCTTGCSSCGSCGSCY